MNNLLSHRESLREILTAYLNNKACVTGSPLSTTWYHVDQIKENQTFSYIWWHLLIWSKLADLKTMLVLYMCLWVGICVCASFNLLIRFLGSPMLHFLLFGKYTYSFKVVPFFLLYIFRVGGCLFRYISYIFRCIRLKIGH